MRKYLIAGNWKMHGLQREVGERVNAIKQGVSDYPSSIDILLLPSFIHLTQVRELLHGTRIQWGAQDLYLGSQGAFTGEVSGTMLFDLGCRTVLIGHSERRWILHEDLSLVAAKFQAAVVAGLQPILCVGETREQRERGETEKVIAQQLESVIALAGIQGFKQAIIAYEPVWAIGTGLTATPEQAADVHAFIRKYMMQNDIDIGKTIRILYGGSMKPDNADSLLAQPNVDGGLIGGASLDAASFIDICAIAVARMSEAKSGII